MYRIRVVLVLAMLAAVTAAAQTSVSIAVRHAERTAGTHATIPAVANGVVIEVSRARRENRMDADEARRAEQAFLEDWADIRKVPVTEELVGSAAQLSWTRELRAYDAVQRASTKNCAEQRKQKD